MAKVDKSVVTEYLDLDSGVPFEFFWSGQFGRMGDKRFPRRLHFRSQADYACITQRIDAEFGSV